MSDLDVHEITKGDFGYGEIAPTFQGRVESPEYKTGSALMYNVIPRAGGGWRRRPGTRFVYVVPADSQVVRKVKFTAKYGQQFALFICLVSGVATIYVFSQATHAYVTTITTNVPAYALADLPAINHASTNGTLWLFMSGTATGTAGGCPVCEIVNAASDGSGAWSASQPTFTNTTAGTPETFGSLNHYPGAGEFYAGRLFLTGTNANPTAQYACTLPAPGTAQTYLIFTIPASPAAADAIYLLQNDMNASRVLWLLATQSLLAGTDKSTWMYPDGVTGTPPTPATYWMKKSASYGALANSRPVPVVNVNLYLGADGKTLRSLILSLQRGFFSDAPLSDHAEHLMSRVAVDFWVTLRPEPIAWIRMADGTIVSANVKQQDTGFIVNAGCGFAQHQIGGAGKVAGGCVLSGTNYDELWLAVVRGTTVSIEYLYLDDINTTAQEDSFYLDCGQTQTSGGVGTTHFTGLPSPLGTQQVAGFGDGRVMPLVTCSGGGVIDYTQPVKKLQVGFPYYSAWWDLIPMLPAKGGALGLLRSIEKAWLKVYNSLGGWVGQTAPSDPLGNPGETLTNFWDKLQILGVMTYGNPPAMNSGFVPVDNLPMQIDDNQGVYVAIVDPVPFNLVSITARYKLVEV
jgi:hypothetical protein